MIKTNVKTILLDTGKAGAETIFQLWSSILPVVHKLLKAEDSATVKIDVHVQAEEEEYMSCAL